MNLSFGPLDLNLTEWFYDYRNDPVTQRYNPVQPLSIEDLRVRMLEAGCDLKRLEDSKYFQWFVYENRRPVGIATISNIDIKMLNAEIGYGAAPDARGRGVATAIVQDLVKRVFDQTPLRKLYAHVHEKNRASRQILEKVGFVQEGLLREQYLVNNQPINEVFYGLLKREWESAREVKN